MDEAPESYAYRCLPLTIANSHGWEVLSPCGFEAEWNGGSGADDVVVRCDPGTADHDRPVALFGVGMFTLHIQGLLRTAPGWNLYVSGPPNSVKDGVAPLSGVIETDWSPYSFTMNWRLTRPHHVVRFEENEPIAFFFPVPRGAAEGAKPRFEHIDADPALKAAFMDWSRSRDAFHQRMREHPPTKPADKWQKLYYRGLAPDGKCPFPDHQAKLQVKPFARAELAGKATQAMKKPVMARPKDAPPLPADPAPTLSASDLDLASLARDLAKREWLLATQRGQRALSAQAHGISRREGVGREAFLDLYYAPGRPVVLAGEMEDWPARAKWTPHYLRDLVGARDITFQAGRSRDPDFERYKDNHLTRGRFDHFIDRILEEGGNDAYLTAYNASANAEALAPLDADLGRLGKFLDHESGPHGGMAWIGPAGTFTSLHHDLTNNLLAQIVGRKRVIMASADDTPNLYNDRHVFSRVRDVTDPDLDLGAYPRLADVTFHEIVLEPGEALFIPVGWWHQVEALDFSVSYTFTNFHWRNDWHVGFPP
jgi:hypothetical protein